MVESRRYSRRPKDKVNQRRSSPIIGMRSIDDRPAHVADRVLPRAWEGDLVMGKNNATAVATLVERTTRYTILVALPMGEVLEGAGGRVDRSGVQHARGTAVLVDVGSGHGDGPARDVDATDGGGCVLRSPAFPMGARDQREPEPGIAAVVAQGNRDHVLPGRAGSDRGAVECYAPETPHIPDPGREIHRADQECC